MKAIPAIKYAFMAIGGLMLLAAVSFYYQTQNFIADAVRADGTVIALKEKRMEGSVSYAPVVGFMTESRKPYKFVSSTGSNPAAYEVGEVVSVLYLASDPQSAKIESFFALWGGTIVFAIFGIPFFSVGFGMWLYGRIKRNTAATLRTSGVPVLAKVKSVERNYGVSMNGRNPYTVVCQWLNPQTSSLHVFESDNIWFDPSEHISSETITVFMQPDNPKKYHVDLSFLPRAAG